MELVFKMKNKKKDNKWIWAVIAILIILGIGAYFLLLGNGVSGLPQPPALPA
jgi:hypothetical protein